METSINLFSARRTPFVVGVNMDNTETTTTAGDDKGDVNEESKFPGGIIGFNLRYWQVAC